MIKLIRLILTSRASSATTRCRCRARRGKKFNSTPAGPVPVPFTSNGYGCVMWDWIGCLNSFQDKTNLISATLHYPFTKQYLKMFHFLNILKKAEYFSKEKSQMKGILFDIRQKNVDEMTSPDIEIIGKIENKQKLLSCKMKEVEK